MRTPMGSNGKDGKIEENCDKPWDFDGESLGFKHKDDEDIMKNSDKHGVVQLFMGFYDKSQGFDQQNGNIYGTYHLKCI